MRTYNGENLTERKLERIYADWLRANGCEEVKLHSRLSGCDLVVKRRGDMSLHEVKLLCETTQLHRGVGQLLFYRFQMERKHGLRIPRLVLVSLTERLDEDTLAFLRYVGIEYCCLAGIVESYFREQEIERNLRSVRKQL